MIAGALKGKGLEIAWVKSSADLFMIQFQGAGRLRLAEGNIIHIAYAARNGRPYTPIGRILRERNYISDGDITIAAIRSWMNQYPQQARQLMAQNQDYVFFQSSAVPVSFIWVTWRDGDRSVALPLPACQCKIHSFRRTGLGRDIHEVPNGGSQSWRHMAFMQDANLAAPLGHVALFTGWGPDADHVAAEQHEPGRPLYIVATCDGGNDGAEASRAA